jgi:hypothetical protein
MSLPNDPYVTEISGIAPAPGWRAFEGCVMGENQDNIPETFEVDDLIIIGWVVLHDVSKKGNEPRGDSHIHLACVDRMHSGYFIYLNPFTEKPWEDFTQGGNSAFQVVPPGEELNRERLEHDVREHMARREAERKAVNKS